MPATRRKTSFVWKYFRVSELDERKAICNICSTVINRGKDSRNYSTSSLAAHVRFCRGKSKGDSSRREDASSKEKDKMKEHRRSAPPNIDILLVNDDMSDQGEHSGVDKSNTSGDAERAEMPDVVTQQEYVMPEPQCCSDDVVCTKRMDLVHSGQMMNMLYQQHRCGKFCDLTLISAQQDNPALVSASGILVASRPPASRKVFKAHSSVLAGLSRKVKTLIEMGSRTIELKDVSPFGLESLLEIVYTGKLRPGPALRYYEIHQIWKAACDLGVEYARNYILQEHPQVSKWIQEEQTHALVEETARYVRERLEEEQSDDLVDMCGVSMQGGEEEENPVKIENIHGCETVIQFPGPNMDIDDNAEKKDDSSLVEITFTKT